MSADGARVLSDDLSKDEISAIGPNDEVVAGKPMESDPHGHVVGKAPPPASPPAETKKAGGTPSRRRSVTVGSQDVEVNESHVKYFQTAVVTWALHIDGVDHVIQLKHGQFSGRRRIYLDGTLVHESRQIIDNGSSHDVVIKKTDDNERKFTVRYNNGVIICMSVFAILCVGLTDTRSSYDDPCTCALTNCFVLFFFF